jgi:hypothetical protein
MIARIWRGAVGADDAAATTAARTPGDDISGRAHRPKEVTPMIYLITKLVRKLKRRKAS